MTPPGFLGPLALVFLAALAAGYLLDRAKLPPIIGFLLAGVLLGPHGLAFVEDVGTVEALAQVGVVPSLYAGFSLPAIELMSCATPLVCTTAGALPVVVGDAALHQALIHS